MTVGDILVSVNQASLETMLPLTAVQTSADIERYYKEGYSVGLTANEFAKKYPRLPVDRIYAAHNMLAPLYYCELDSTTVPIVLSLNIYGDKRLAVNSESDEKFQQRILDMAEKISSGNVPFIRGYLFSLEDSLRVSVLSKYIELSSPGENLYALFLDFYRTSDFGFSALKEDNLQKVFSGKSQKQKQNTEKKLSSLPDIVTIYRGEGSKSTPYEKSFSWTTSYKVACFFDWRMPHHLQIFPAAIQLLCVRIQRKLRSIPDRRVHCPHCVAAHLVNGPDNSNDVLAILWCYPELNKEICKAAVHEKCFVNFVDICKLTFLWQGICQLFNFLTHQPSFFRMVSGFRFSPDVAQVMVPVAPESIWMFLGKRDCGFIGLQILRIIMYPEIICQVHETDSFVCNAFFHDGICLRKHPGFQMAIWND